MASTAPAPGPTAAADNSSGQQILLDIPIRIGYSASMSKSQISEAASALGKRGWRAKVKKLGMERIQAIARENGKRGGRPPKANAEGR
jgi:hypothetical protein